MKKYVFELMNNDIDILHEIKKEEYFDNRLQLNVEDYYQKKPLEEKKEKEEKRVIIIEL